MFEAAKHPLLVPFDGSFDVDEARSKPHKDKKADEWQGKLESETAKLGASQHRLYSRGTHSMLIVLQALDAAGKDGTIRHVFSHINPSGLRVASFKAPTALEASHDFLWRTSPHLPPHGHLSVFNRSYYEEVLVVRVHPDFLGAQHLTKKPSRKFWRERYRAIEAHERHLARQGTVILKFWLNVSKKEQRARLLERIDDPEKRWKFRAADLDERDLFDDYLHAYEDCLNATSRPWAPWYAIPADDKHFMRWQVARLVNDAFAQLDLDFPQPTKAGIVELERARARLLAE
jgi:PPK2 family polyphosphate:nucleotide phosphotransferase